MSNWRNHALIERERCSQDCVLLSSSLPKVAYLLDSSRMAFVRPRELRREKLMVFLLKISQVRPKNDRQE